MSLGVVQARAVDSLTRETGGGDLMLRTDFPGRKYAPKTGPAQLTRSLRRFNSPLPFLSWHPSPDSAPVFL